MVTTEAEIHSTAVKRAQECGAYVVSFEWLSDSLEKGQRLPEANYFIGDIPQVSFEVFTHDKYQRNSNVIII